MRAIVCESYGPAEVLSLKEVAKPKPKATEILVKIKSTAVNSGDVRVRGFIVDGIQRILMKLVLGSKKPRKPILGLVFSGIVEELGANVKKFKVGDEVFGMTGFQFGCYAEYICVKEHSVVCERPSNASFDEAVSIIFGGTSAYHFLKKAKIDQTPKKILIYGAAGSVGVAGVQIAKYYDADITAVVSGKGIELMESLGVNKIVDYSKGEFQNLKADYDIVFDAVGKIGKKDFSHVLNPNCIFKSVEGWDVATESLDKMLFLKKLFEEGKYKAVIDKIFKLEEIVDAHRYVQTGKKKGDVVIQVA
ncbi:MAG: NAD(P)-dependent alcohol dehydrogenase [Leptospira sp.]|nr:NAD(P)-dependent alcohol dehydrogenase [Leptospira sp.]